MVEKLPLTVESMNKMKAQEMEEEQIIQFAKDALNTRFKEDELNRIQIDLKELVNPVRKEDAGLDCPLRLRPRQWRPARFATRDLHP